MSRNGWWFLRLGELDFCAFSCFLSGKLKIAVPLKALAAARTYSCPWSSGPPVGCWTAGFLLEWEGPDTSSCPFSHPLLLLVAFWGRGSS